jgi:TonB-dependent SusC/RagA subfamily outer membrane receptor
MKALTIILCLFYFSNNAFGQNSAIKTGAFKQTSGEASNIKSYNPLYVINGQLVIDTVPDHVMKTVNASDILQLKILKGDSASAIYGEEWVKGVVLITTKKYAKTMYQSALSTFSDKYKDYLETHQNNDENIAYLINGRFLKGKDDAYVIALLYEIPVRKIKTVDFTEKRLKNIFTDIKPVVDITTRK